MVPAPCSSEVPTPSLCVEEFFLEFEPHPDVVLPEPKPLVIGSRPRVAGQHELVAVVRFRRLDGLRDEPLADALPATVPIEKTSSAQIWSMSRQIRVCS